MPGPTTNLIFKNRKMYIKLYTIWHCDFVEKKEKFKWKCKEKREIYMKVQ